MTLELTSEQEAIVQRLAKQAGLTPAELVVGAMAHLDWLDDAAERELIEARMAEADRGDFVPPEEMEAAFQQMLRRR